MQVCNPQTLLKSLDSDSLSDIEKRYGTIERFLGPGDTFKFSCDKSGSCCKGRDENPIILFPYDAYRIQTRLNIGIREFVSEYAHTILGAESKLPMLILRSKWLNEFENKCVFLDSSNCSIYEDRPLVCRLFPVGRLADREGRSYFFLTKTDSNCRVGVGKERSIENWLEESDTIDHFKWNDRYQQLFLRINYKKYHKMPPEFGSLLGTILYDFDFPVNSEGQNPSKPKDPNDGDWKLHRSHLLAQNLIEKYLT